MPHQIHDCPECILHLDRIRLIVLLQGLLTSLSSMNPKKTLSELLSSLRWIAPFFCFLAGYFILNLFFTSSQTTTPHVVGLALPEALKVLAKENLNVRLIATKEDPQIPEDTIVSQNPSPGSTIRPQQTVFVVVSGKPPVLTTPRYIGQSASVLLKQLREEGVAHQHFFVPSNHPQGTCIAQTPREGELIDTHPLVLYFSQNPSSETVIVPSFEKRSVEEVSTFLAAHNCTFSVFHECPVSAHHDCSRCFVTEQKPRAGTSISRTNPPTMQLKVNG